MENVKRDRYLSQIVPFVGNRNAKVLAGIRRGGKSTISHMISAGFGDDHNVIDINMDLFGNRRYRDPEKLYGMIKGSLISGKKNRLFIDEVQDVDEWESVIRSLIAEDCCDIYLTGSNSRLLSGEFATYLTGRLNILDVFTLTFSECLDFERKYRGEADTDIMLEKFLHFGGFPSVWRNDYKMSEAIKEITDIVNMIMMRDIISRYAVKNPDVLYRILNYLCDNVGNLTSVNNIYASLHADDRTIGKDMVYSYVSYLENAYLVTKVPTFDIKGKRHLASVYKYYLGDIGIKNAALGYRADDIDGYMENIIYLELRSRGYNVWIGNNNGKEVDLVGEKNGRYVYVQTAVELSSEKVVRREFGNLEGIADNYPKFVVTLEDGLLNNDLDGIICCELKDFLLRSDY
ncbi:MAG: ATP-binding protein [Methanomassiliicoccaceae archaeon]|nr:ATP-binding protein [Methanomassiliicoccaceae archaeon]